MILYFVNTIKVADYFYSLFWKQAPYTRDKTYYRSYDEFSLKSRLPYCSFSKPSVQQLVPSHMIYFHDERAFIIIFYIWSTLKPILQGSPKSVFHTRQTQRLFVPLAIQHIDSHDFGASLYAICNNSKNNSEQSLSTSDYAVE